MSTSDSLLYNSTLANRAFSIDGDNHLSPKINFYIYDTVNSNTYNVSNLIGDMNLTSQIEGQPDTLNFTIYTPESNSEEYGSISFFEGAVIEVYLDDLPYFKGVLFSKSRTEDVRVINCTAYSTMKYLQFNLSYTRTAQTVVDLFNALCEEQGIDHDVKISSLSSYTLQDRVEDGSSIYTIFANAIDEHEAMTGQRLILRDYFGVITLCDIQDCVTDYIIGDLSYVVSFSYQSDIENAVNTVKVVKKTDSDGEEETVVERNDPTSEGWWGTLQRIENVDDSYSEEAMATLAEQLLELYDTKNRTISLNIIGIPLLKAGDIIKLRIADLGDIAYDSYLIIDSVSHTFDNNTVDTSISATITRSGA